MSRSLWAALAGCGGGGGRASFSVEAKGGRPLAYRWTKDGEFAGATATVPYFGPGTFTVTVSNALGSATASARL